MTFHKNNKCDDSSAFEPKKTYLKKTMNTRKEAKDYNHHVNNKTFYKKALGKITVKQYTTVKSFELLILIQYCQNRFYFFVRSFEKKIYMYIRIILSLYTWT